MEEANAGFSSQQLEREAREMGVETEDKYQLFCVLEWLAPHVYVYMYVKA